jgi:hypothetical protein
LGFCSLSTLRILSSLAARADVETGNANIIALGSIHPVPRFACPYWSGSQDTDLDSVTSPLPLIIEHRQFYGSLFPSWGFALFQRYAYFPH